MLTLNDGRSELWQWDTGRKLTVDAECSQVHFSNKVFGRSIDVDVVDKIADIPDVLLQTDKDLNVWAFVGTAENGYTKISKTFKVNWRNKPADYVFTPVEQVTIQEVKAIAQIVRDDASAAADSATSAANKAAEAASSAENAEASARAAAQRESAAANEAASAASHAGAAAQAAAAAESKASEADVSAAKAATSESNAANKAAEAADSANASAQSRSAAGVSAAEAETAAKDAAQSAAAAAQSAGNAAAAATNAANAVLEQAKASGEFDGPVGKDGTSFFYSTASLGTVIGSLYSFDLSTIETNGRTISAGDFILSAVGYIYRVEANLGTYVNAVCIQRGVGVDGSSLFYSTMDADHYVGGRWAIALDTISTMGRKISEGDLILAANDFLYRVVAVGATEVDGECLQRWSGIDGLCIYHTYSTPTKTSSGSRYYTISGGSIETFGRQFSVGDLILAGDGEMYRIDALLDQPPNHLYLEWLTRWQGRDGRIQTVNGIEPDENGNVEIVAGTQPDWNQNDSTALDYVKNRTHWVESNSEFSAEITVGSYTEENIPFTPVLGREYDVTYGDTVYHVTAKPATDSGLQCVYIGNGSLKFNTEENTGEPWIYFTYIIDGITASSALWTDETVSDDKISVYQVTEIIHPLPGKFLPNGVPYVEESGMVELPVTGQWFEETDADGNVTNSMYVVTAPIGLQIGNTYIVNWNGTDYEVTGQDVSVISGGEMSGVFLGNLAAMGGDDTGEPFAVLEVPADIAAEMGAYGQIISLDLSINIPFTIYGENVTVHKLDNRCLDLDWLPVTKEYDIIPEFTATVGAGEPFEIPNSVGAFNAVTDIESVTAYINGTAYPVTTVSDLDGTYILIDGRFLITPGQNINCMFFPKSEGGTYTVRVCASDKNKMPAEFLPKGTPYVQEDVLLAETNAESSEDPTFGQIWVIQGVTLNLTAGETYTILYNGTPYKCVCQTAPDGFTNDPDAVAMGNFAAIGGEDTGEPFALLSQPNYKAIAIIDFVGSTAVKVGISGEVVQKMDARCLPDNATAFYLTSPNGTKFAVTVDDNGTLTATAV